MAQVKCRFCKAQIDKETAIAVSEGKRNKYYCNEECETNDENKNKRKKIQKQTTIEKEASHWKQLMDYITNLYGNKINYPFLCTQIKNMKNEFNMKDSGILLTLQYMYEVRELTFDDDKGLGLVPYYYQDAKEFYIKKFKIAEMVKNTKINDTPIIINKIVKIY